MFICGFSLIRQGLRRYITTKKAAAITRNGLLVVVMDGIEPPTQGFSVLCSTD